MKLKYQEGDNLRIGVLQFPMSFGSNIFLDFIFYFNSKLETLNIRMYMIPSTIPNLILCNYSNDK